MLLLLSLLVLSFFLLHISMHPQLQFTEADFFVSHASAWQNKLKNEVPSVCHHRIRIQVRIQTLSLSICILSTGSLCMYLCGASVDWEMRIDASDIGTRNNTRSYVFMELYENIFILPVCARGMGGVGGPCPLLSVCIYTGRGNATVSRKLYFIWIGSHYTSLNMYNIKERWAENGSPPSAVKWLSETKL